jgi:Ca2+-binding RTX toxin-like protein
MTIRSRRLTGAQSRMRRVLGRIFGGGLALIALGAVLAGEAEGRGGNHGCDPGERSVRSDDYWPGGDVVVVGYFTEEAGFPPETQETITAENFGNDKGSNSVSCGAPVGTWTLFTSALGPGDDSVRMDARGLDDKDDFDPLPRRVASEVTGGGGADVIRGHVGFDDMSGDGGADRLIPGAGADRVLGGAGPDVIKAAGGGGDDVQCGAGRDKAVVDERDDTSGCERLIVR